MTTGDILLIIIMFSGSIVFCCVANYMCCSEEDFIERPTMPLQNKDANSVVVIQEI
jgi:hypothetical protein